MQSKADKIIQLVDDRIDASAQNQCFRSPLLVIDETNMSLACTVRLEISTWTVTTFKTSTVINSLHQPDGRALL